MVALLVYEVTGCSIVVDIVVPPALLTAVAYAAQPLGAVPTLAMLLSEARSFLPDRVPSKGLAGHRSAGYAAQSIGVRVTRSGRSPRTDPN